MRQVNSERVKVLRLFEKKIGYKFKNIELLNRALTHSSFANEHKDKLIKYNERLEFLGDSVLGLVISDYLFQKYPKYPEGELTKIRAIIVCEPSLSLASKNLNLGRRLLLGNGEEATGGRERNSILADAFEALIGAIFLDGSIKKAREFILDNLKLIIKDAVNGRLFSDYKTQLQEYLQKNDSSKIDYIVINEEGPDHNKIFHVQVRVAEKILGEGSGKSKKEAEQNAAKKALDGVGINHE